MGKRIGVINTEMRDYLLNSIHAIDYGLKFRSSIFEILGLINMLSVVTHSDKNMHVAYMWVYTNFGVAQTRYFYVN